MADVDNHCKISYEMPWQRLCVRHKPRPSVRMRDAAVNIEEPTDVFFCQGGGVIHLLACRSPFYGGGLVTREQLLDLGITPSLIRRLLEHDELVRVRRGVYSDPVAWAAADEYRGRPRLRARAALMRMRRGWVLSHDSAAHDLGLEILQPDTPLVHITRPGLTNAWTKAFNAFVWNSGRFV